MHINSKGEVIFYPTDLSTFAGESPFASWMDRALEVDKKKFKDFINPEKDIDKTMQVKGNEHEAQYLKKLKKNKKIKIVEIPQDKTLTDEFRKKMTLDAMKDGADIIFQAQLSMEHFTGKADFLVKRAGESKVGKQHHYEVQDTKLSHAVKPRHILQICCYIEMLELIQGIKAHDFSIILGTGDIESLRTLDFYDYYLTSKEAFLAFHAFHVEYDIDKIPDPANTSRHGRWSDYAGKILAERDHLSLIAGITRNQIKNLCRAGIKTVTDLVACKMASKPKNKREFILARLREQASLQVDSRGQDQPKYRVLEQSDEGESLGLNRLPPADDGDVYFDMEGYPLIKGGLEYLFGVSFLDGKGKEIYKEFWAHDRAQEKKAFEEFMGWIHKRSKKYPNMHVYHYGHYETTALKRLSGFHGTCRVKLDNFLRRQIFVDLFGIVRNGVRIGAPSYSIKDIELLYKEKRTGGVVDAGESIVQYDNWLKLRDGSTPDDSDLLASIRDYNKDDCESTAKLAHWLRERQKEHGIAYCPIEDSVALEDDKDKTDDDLPTDQAPTTQEVEETLKHMKDYHRLEENADWWLYFKRRDKYTLEEFQEDKDCIAECKVISKSENGNIKNRWTAKYRFDEEQEVKIKEKNKFLIHGDKIKCMLTEFDEDANTIEIKCDLEPKDLINLLPIPPDINQQLKEAIKDYVDGLTAGNVPHKALDDFLFHRPPNIMGQVAGESLIDQEKDIVHEVIRVIKAMHDTSLCVQGPPGAGKTHVSAMAILELLKDGKRVGITSNSHESVGHLMDMIIRLSGKPLTGMVKVNKDANDTLCMNHTTVFRAESGGAKYLTYNTSVGCVGGTAWVFANTNALGQFDYLFIDEAGQVPVANLVAMARSTKNIVIIGDQQQLSQPIKGTHPGRSGLSCMEYLLAGKQTIENHMGIFLPTTRRLHPSICLPISESVYDGRLQSDPVTAKRSIQPNTRDKSPWAKVEAGIVHVEVQHEGFSQYCPDEVDEVDKICQSLKGRIFIEDGKNRKLTMDDILIVSPYNLQVRKLKKRLGGDAAVGTIDKFQGQEKPVVIISMCDSTLENSSRGISFLLCKKRLNVAVTRAKCLAFVVSSPELAGTSARTVDNAVLLNFYCRIVREGKLGK